MNTKKAEEKAVEYLIKLVKTPSPSGSEKELAHLLRDMLGEAGFDRVLLDRV